MATIAADPCNVKTQADFEEPRRLASFPNGDEYENRRVAAQQIEKMLRDFALEARVSSLDGWRDIIKLEQCSTFIEFGVREKSEKVRVLYRNACRLRKCVFCAWFRAMRMQARAVARLPPILAEHPTCAWLMLTLTQPNVPVAELSSELTRMNKAWAKMLKWKAWPAIGWIRSIEVTYENKGEKGRAGYAHPHSHILLMVKASYFSKYYINQAEWSEMWRKALKLETTPIVDIRRIQPGEKEQAVALSEVIKYAVKSSELHTAGRDWVLRIFQALRGRRLLASGGVLKGIFKDDDRDTDAQQLELLNPENEDDNAELRKTLHAKWQRKEESYICRFGDKRGSMSSDQKTARETWKRAFSDAD